MKKINEELIQMYWKVGEYLSTESTKVSFGDAYIDIVAEEVQNVFPGIKGFNRRGLYRMKKFYETYADDLPSSFTRGLCLSTHSKKQTGRFTI